MRDAARMPYPAAVTCISLHSHFNARPYNHGQSRYQDFHRLRRAALSQQNPWFTLYRRRRLRRCHDVMLFVWQAPAAQPTEVATAARQGTVRLFAHLQGCRRRRQRQSLTPGTASRPRACRRIARAPSACAAGGASVCRDRSAETRCASKTQADGASNINPDAVFEIGMW